VLDLSKDVHRRFNPLTGEWVLVSPHRTDRPWQGQVEKIVRETVSDYDPECYLCPGNARAGSLRNPEYADTFVFDNDFPALLPDGPIGCFENDGLIQAYAERGICRVVCFSPRHGETLSRMDAGDIRKVVDVWAGQYKELGDLPFINSVQIFENRGAMMGASNPHPHCQIWANSTVPDEVGKELSHCLDYSDRTGECLLCRYLRIEEQERERIVCENEHFAAVVPFWAMWPFEMLLLPRHHATDLCALNDDRRYALAEILKEITTRYDRLFDAPFPYTMGFHQRPTDGSEDDSFHMHVHFYPPLLRSATVRKFMVGYEMLAMPQRDITPETAAARLREIGEE
jgi:UDPglucose--hexose-1-phosphate uridylyltransferase